jgi:hypothetical protein
MRWEAWILAVWIGLIGFTVVYSGYRNGDRNTIIHSWVYAIAIGLIIRLGTH